MSNIFKAWYSWTLAAPRAACLAFLGTATIVIFLCFPYSPLQDLPEWIYQGYVFNQIVSGHTILGVYLKTYPIPYTSVQLLISGCLVFFDPMVTSKLVVASYVALAMFASKRLIIRYEMRPAIAWPVLISLFVLNSSFWNGYMAYQFGLLIPAFYLSLGSRWRTDVRILTLFSLLAFFTHGVIYFTFIVTAFAFWLSTRRLLLFALGVLPSMLLAVWYAFSNVTPKVGGPPVILANIGEFAAYKLYTFMKMGPYHDFIIFGTPSMGQFDRAFSFVGIAINLAFLSALAILVYLANRGRSWFDIIRTPELILATTLVFIACVLNPTALGVGNPSERLVYPAFLALSALALKPRLASDLKNLEVFATASLSVILFAGFTLSSIGLVAAAGVYGRTKGRDAIEAAPTSDNGERIRFGHRLVQFELRMRETDREWRSGQLPTMIPAFDTALLGHDP